MRLSRNESGFALILTLGILLVTSFDPGDGDPVRDPSRPRRKPLEGRSESRTRSPRPGSTTRCRVLAKPANNALNSTLLPARVSTYENGDRRRWSGSFNPMNGAVDRSPRSARVRNPTGPTAAPGLASDRRDRSDVVPTLSQPLNSQAWNYIYSRRDREHVRHDDPADRGDQLAAARRRGNLCLAELVAPCSRGRSSCGGQRRR